MEASLPVERYGRYLFYLTDIRQFERIYPKKLTDNNYFHVPRVRLIFPSDLGLI